MTWRKREIEALKQALEALEEHHYGVAQIIIREALAQPQQEQESVAMADYVALMKKYVALKAAQPEPDACKHEWFRTGAMEPRECRCIKCGAWNTTPPQRTWVGLTNNELQPIADEYRILFGSWVEDFARAIEAKLKEKNT